MTTVEAAPSVKKALNNTNVQVTESAVMENGKVEQTIEVLDKSYIITNANNKEKPHTRIRTVKPGAPVFDSNGNLLSYFDNYIRKA